MREQPRLTLRNNRYKLRCWKMLRALRCLTTTSRALPIERASRANNEPNGPPESGRCWFVNNQRPEPPVRLTFFSFSLLPDMMLPWIFSNNFGI